VVIFQVEVFWVVVGYQRFRGLYIKQVPHIKFNWNQQKIEKI